VSDAEFFEKLRFSDFILPDDSCLFPLTEKKELYEKIF